AARHDGGAGGKAAALDCRRHGWHLCDLPWPRPWRGAAARHQRAGLLGGLCDRHRLSASCRHCVRPAGALASRTACGARGRRRDCVRRADVPWPPGMSARPGIVAVFGLVLLGLVPTAQPALAHPVPLGIPGFFGGLLHPAFVPAHLMAALGLGILIGQQAPQWGRAAPATFIVSLIAALAVLTSGVVPRFALEAVLL